MIQSRLRLLFTSDLHMHIVSDRDGGRTGLAGLVPLIVAAKADPTQTLLFDNGDFLQGTLLGDHLAEREGGVHPMIAAFNTLGFDAVTLGNHEFDYGLDRLMDILADCEMPVVCANARTGPFDTLLPPWTMIERELRCSDGSLFPVRVGVIGFVTPQVTTWNAHHLRGRVFTDDIIASARTHVPQLRREGADIVVALCHSGVSGQLYKPRMENAALHLASVPGVDAVMGGHTHSRYEGVDHAVIVPPPFGMALGSITLDLVLTEDGFRVDSHRCRLLEPRPGPDKGLIRQISQPLEDGRAEIAKAMSRPVTRTPRRLTSYLAMLGRDDTAPLVAAAQVEGLREGLAGTAFDGLPILSATAPFQAGGHGGPQNFADIGPGPVTLGDLTRIVPFDNAICGILRRGWQIRQWLERSAAIFQTLVPGETRPLLHPQIAAYHFDTIHGLRYRIDLSVPPRPEGASDRASRVRDITFDGKPLADDAVFLVAVSVYRAFGGGDLTRVEEDEVVLTVETGQRALLERWLRANGVPDDRPAPNWRLLAPRGAVALLETGPGLDLPDPHPTEPLIARDDSETGDFARLRLTF